MTADALERGRIKNVVGAYPFCGALAGSRTWDRAHGLRLTYDAICGDIPEAAIPGGATGLPPGVPGIGGAELLAAVNACTGIAMPPGSQSPQQLANLQKLLDSTQLPVNFILQDMFFATNGISNLIFAPDKLDGGLGLGNIGVEFSDPDINAAIQRVIANRKAARKLKNNFTPKGKLRNDDVKILSIHNDKDGLVIVENEKEYQDVVDADNLTVAVVVEPVPTHCGFNAAEGVAGWESLRAWIAGVPQPDAQDLQLTCLGIETGGVFGGPCRFDASYEIADMDGRIPARDNTSKRKKKKHDEDSDSDSGH